MMTDMMRDPESHKGENGKVAIIGGSRSMHGAPIFAALAAEAAGADLLYMFVPPAHEEITKARSLNFQVQTFRSDEIGADDVGGILQMLASMDVAVIGPGLAREALSLKAIKQIVMGCPCPLVLDASALQPETLEWVAGKVVVLTPHLGELERMGLDAEDLPRIAEEQQLTFLLKGPRDLIIDSSGNVRESAGGNAGLTVGGTGDALAGLTAGLIAQRVPPAEAAFTASQTIKTIGELLAEEQASYTTEDVIEQIPFVLKEEPSL